MKKSQSVEVVVAPPKRPTKKSDPVQDVAATSRRPTKKSAFGPKEKLLQAALAFARKNGIGDVSLRQLAGELGTSHRMLIYHFKSKEGLLIEIIRGIEAGSLEVFAGINANPHLSANERIRMLWESITQPSRAGGDRLWVEVYGQALQGKPYAVAILDWIIHPWLEPLAKLSIDAGVPPAEAEADARLILGVLRGLHMDQLATGERERVNAAFERFLAYHCPPRVGSKRAEPPVGRRAARRG